jgi:hypothetical protein
MLLTMSRELPWCELLQKNVTQKGGYKKAIDSYIDVTEYIGLEGGCGMSPRSKKNIGEYLSQT